jgi:hypothetical protein
MRNDFCSSTICEDLYFPNIAIPSRVTELEPAFASCSPFRKSPSYVRPHYWIDGGWDPNLVLQPASVVPVPTMPRLPILPKLTPVVAVASPGAIHSAPDLPATTTVPDEHPYLSPHALETFDDTESEFVHVAESGFKGPMNHPSPYPSPITLDLSDGAKITISKLPGSGSFLVDSQILRVGGPPIVANGNSISLGPKDQLIVGGANTFRLPQELHIQTTVIRINGIDITGTLQHASGSNVGSLILGSAKIQPGGSEVIVNGKTLSLDTNGIISDKSNAIATISWHPSRDSDVDIMEDETVESIFSKTRPTANVQSSTKKNSGAKPYDHTLTLEVFALGLVFGLSVQGLLW